MAHDCFEALASKDNEALRIENKRKFDETVNRNWDGGKAVIPAAPVPSCSNVRPPLSELDLMRQSVAEIVAYSLTKFKRPRAERAVEDLSRAEEAAEDLSEPVCTNDLRPGAAFSNDYSEGDHEQPPKEILPVHRQQFYQGAQSHNQRNFNQSRKIDVPNLKVSAGEAGVGSNRDCGGPGSSLEECVQVKFTNDKVTVAMDKALTRTLAMKVYSLSVDSAQSLKCEFRWEQGL